MPAARPRLDKTTQYGHPATGSFWVEYPDGTVDVTRTHPLTAPDAAAPPKQDKHIEVAVDGDRKVRFDPARAAIVIVDMQNFFLHPELRAHPLGLACVDPLLNILPVLRAAGVRIIWLNWGLTPYEAEHLPPALHRSFSGRTKPGGFGTDLGGTWGKLLMRDTRNAELYGPLQDAWREGEAAGTDVWVHKNRMGGLWGGSLLAAYLQAEGLTTLFFSGVNSDQCVLGTMVDAYFAGYDVVAVRDTTATTSPTGALESLMHNTLGSYGFVTDSERVLQAA